MAIVDFGYYATVYIGREASEDDFAVLSARAEDIIGAMTRWQIEAIATLPAHIQTLVKKAICAQIDYFAVNGLDSVTGNGGGGFTVGKVSVSGAASAEGKGAMATYIAPMAMMYLEQSGLLNPQVETGLDMPMIGGWY